MKLSFRDSPSRATALVLAASFSMALPVALPTDAGAADTCSIAFRLQTRVELADIQFDVAYGATAEAVPVDQPLGCQSLVSNAALAFNDDKESMIVTVGLIRAQPFSGPVDVAKCSFSYDSVTPAADEFVVTVTGADSLPEGGGIPEPVVPLPKLVVSNIDCEPGLATTTTTTTTTTLPDSLCGNPLAGSDATSAADALYILRTVFFGETCDPCLCDVNGSGSITVVDAQFALHAALGLPAELNCPTCF